MLDTIMSSSCRTCMKNNVNLVHLYESLQIDESSNLQLVELLMECTAIQVKQEDGLPQNLCEECTNVLRLSFSFRQQAAKAEEEFKKLLENEVKQEIKVEDEPDYFNDFTDSQLEITNTADDLKMELEETIYTCTKCSKTYTKEKKYLKHLESHTLSFSCPYCGKRYQKNSTLQKHVLKHEQTSQTCTEINSIERTTDDSLFNNLYDTVVIKNEDGEDEPRYQCQECEKSFTKPRSLSMHMKVHEREKGQLKYTCDSCDKQFYTKPSLKRHLKLHIDKKPYQCVKCEKRYSRKDQLASHTNTHKDNKPYNCPHCSKAFAQMCSLKDHIRTHTKETPYLCSECGKGFANSSNLRQHMLRHTGDKPHKCKLCPKSFCTKGQMTSHLVTHTGAHPYKCDKCGAAFTKSNSLKKHAMIHLGQRPFGCDTCLMRFTCKDHLKRHNRIHTGEKPYKCKYCERAFTQSNDLVKHMRSHLGQNIYDCSVCGLGFRLQSELKQHYPVHFCSDDPTLKSLLEQSSIDHKLTEDHRIEPQPNIKENQMVNIPEKFMITINSVDGSNMVAINIEPESTLLKV